MIHSLRIAIYFSLLICTYSCNHSIDIPSHSFTIFSGNDIYYVENNISHKVEKESKDLATVYNFVLSKLKGKGGKLSFLAGKYQISEPLLLCNNLTIEGEGSSTIFTVSDNFSGGKALFIADSLNDIRIKQLTIKQSNKVRDVSGIILSHCGTSKVTDVFVLGVTGYGIWMKNCSFLCEIRGCNLGGIQKTAIYLDELQKGRAGDWVPNLVSNCTIYSSQYGIELNRAIVANIVNCIVYQARKHAYYLHGQSNSVIISGCRSHQTGDVAVMIHNSHELNVSSNVFAWHEKDGIVLDDVAWATVSANEFIDNGSFNPMDESNMEFNLNGRERPFRVKQEPEHVDNVGFYNGVTLKNKCRGVTVSANAIFNWPAAHPMNFGIEEDETCYGNNFIGNNINYCKNSSISIKGKGSIADNNVFAQYPPHAGNMEIIKPESREIQGFDLRLMEHFIKGQMKE